MSLKEIYELGARKIGVFAGPPVGCVPYHRTLSGGIERKCIQKYNNAVMLFNDKLLREIGFLNQKLPNSRIVYIDVYNPLLDIIVNHQKYGNFSLRNLFITLTVTIFDDFNVCMKIMQGTKSETEGVVAQGL